MSSKVALLRQLLRESVATHGTIITLQGAAAQVATGLGTITATVPPGLSVRPGDSVKIQDKIILGRVRDRAALPVYDL